MVVNAHFLLKYAALTEAGGFATSDLPVVGRVGLFIFGAFCFFDSVAVTPAGQMLDLGDPIGSGTTSGTIENVHFYLLVAM
ncbi:hypothetical protein ON010_g3442 [Phytophthora cinnamomi]|nr:hypothetical protein ON010_g3442 [Phytophthora cinnamomi]